MFGVCTDKGVSILRRTLCKYVNGLTEQIIWIQKSVYSAVNKIILETGSHAKGVFSW